MNEIGQPAPIPYPAISIGRSELATRIASVLRKPWVNLLTLTGPGGIGKTHLALEIARDFQHDPAAQVTFLSLADTETQADATRSITDLLNQHPPEQSALSRSTPGHHPSLVILDNLEHLRAMGPQLGNVLTRHPSLKLLATSRHPLDIQIEHLWKIPPLETPNGVSVASLDDLARFDGCQLFLAIAAMVAPGNALCDDHAPTIASLCNRLGGSPLAIHIAARQLRHHSLGELELRVEHLLDIGMVGAQDVPQRHQSLRASISWSYKLLTANELTGFCQLGVFPASFPSDAAVTLIAQGIDGQSTSISLSTARTVLASLVDQHLVQREVRATDDDMRLRLDPAVREYARERLSVDGGYDHARRVLALWCVEFVESAATRTDRDDLIAAESANLAEARAWMIASGEWALGFRLVDALYSYWLIRGCSGEECEWLGPLLDVAPESIPIEQERHRARIMNMLGLVSHTHANFDAAERAYFSALSLRRKLEDHAGVLDTLHNLALLAFSLGDLELAEQRFAEPIALAREIRNQRSLASSLCYLGSIRNERGNRDGARQAIS
jgi:predicted ATPase